jgi:dTDP-glucose 4,6-dehydratase
MKTLLVTGGAGFIGANFVRYWRHRHPHDRVINLDALTYAGNLENLAGVTDGDGYRFVHGDICDAALVNRLFAEEAINTVINFAAESHVDRSISAPERFLRSNIEGTFSLLQAAAGAWLDDPAGCRFLQVSTDEVFGALGPDDPPFTEQTRYAPNSPYAASKAAADHLVRAWFHTYGLPVLTTNCSNNYGPYQFPEKLIPLVISNALNDLPLPIYGDGRNVRDWLYVEDHCRGIEAVLMRGRLGETYTIGGGNEWTNIDIVRHICHTLDELRPGSGPREALITYVEDRPGHDRRYAIDAGKLIGELGWSPRYPFEQGIRATVQWYLEHEDWVTRVRSGDYQDYYRQHYAKHSSL